jgi:uncharacterized RDD family membrane protein YckC
MTQPPDRPDEPGQGPGDPRYPPPAPGSRPPSGYGPPPGYGYPPPGQGYPPPGYAGFPPSGYPIPRLANWGLRAGAYLLDALIPLPGAIIAAVILALAGTSSTSIDASGASVQVTSVDAVPLTVAILIYLATFGVYIYNRWIRQGRTGQSWGKQLVKLRLLSEDTGQPIGGGMAFVRDLAHILDSLACYLGWLWPLWDAKRQTFADKLIRTIVTAED